MLNDLAIAFIPTKGSRFNILTRLACERYAERLGLPLLVADGVDAALAQAPKRYLLVQRAGSLILSPTFFSTLTEEVTKYPSLYYGVTTVEDDFATIDSTSLLIDVQLWRELDAPEFQGRSRKLPNIKYELEWQGQNRPPSFTYGEGEAYASDYCSTNGAQFVAAQLQRFERVTNISREVLDERFFFDERYAHSELFSLTKFEHLKQTRLDQRVTLFEQFNKPSRPACDILFTPAEGLNALKMVNETTASTVVVYSPREAELEFQRKLFAMTKAHTLGNVVAALKQQLPNCYFDEVESKRFRNFVVYHANRPIDVTFVRGDIVGYEVELVLQAGLPREKNKSILFDFGHTYADPLNYVNRSRADVYAMFNYTCGRLKSNAGPALIHGVGAAGRVYDSHLL